MTKGSKYGLQAFKKALLKSICGNKSITLASKRFFDRNNNTWHPLIYLNQVNYVKHSLKFDTHLYNNLVDHPFYVERYC